MISILDTFRRLKFRSVFIYESLSMILTDIGQRLHEQNEHWVEYGGPLD